MARLRRLFLQTVGALGAVIGLLFLTGLSQEMFKLPIAVVLAGFGIAAGYSAYRPFLTSPFVGRVGSGVVAVFAMLLAMATGFAPPEAEQMAALRAKNPTAYLAAVQRKDPGLWMTELAVLDPAQLAIETAKQADAAALAAKVAEDARVAAEQADKAAAATKAAEAAQLAEAEAAQKASDFAALHQQIVADIAGADWVQARSHVSTARRNFADDFAAVSADIEATALKAAKALPATDPEANHAAYALLALIQPEDAGYAAKVKTYDDRQAAVRAKAEATRLAAVKKLIRNVDKVEGVTYLQSRNQPKYLNSRTSVYLYIGTRESGQSWLRMKVQYAASDWLFVQDMVVGMEGTKVDFISGPFERDNNSKIWEWVDVEPSPMQIALLRKMAKLDDVTLRFVGQQYHKDVALSSKDKQGLREVLAAWDVLHGS